MPNVFDLIFFKGRELFSTMIVAAEEMANEEKVPLYSHVGVVVDKNILPIPELKDGVLYVMESTCSYEYPGGGKVTKDIYGKRKFGIQIRVLDDVVKGYHGNISYGNLIHNPKIQSILPFWNKFKNGGYDSISLLATIIPCLRPPSKGLIYLANDIGIHMGEYPFIFCSELVAILFRDIGLIPKKIDPSIVMPIDFIGARNLFPPIVNTLVPLK